MAKSPEVITRFFSWEGDACRLHKEASGVLTADLYRGGMGIVPINPSDILFGAKEVSKEAYEALVQEESALHAREGQG